MTKINKSDFEEAIKQFLIIDNLFGKEERMRVVYDSSTHFFSGEELDEFVKMMNSVVDELIYVDNLVKSTPNREGSSYWVVIEPSFLNKGVPTLINKDCCDFVDYAAKDWCTND